MGANCGCLKQDKELELNITNPDPSVNEKSIAPVKRPNWEDKFLEFIRDPPIPNESIKV